MSNLKKEQSLSTKLNELTISSLRKKLEELEKQGLGDIVIIHSNNYIYTTELIDQDSNKFLKLIGIEQ